MAGTVLAALLLLSAALATPPVRAQDAPLAELSAAALALSAQARRATPERGTAIVLGSALDDAVLRDVSMQIDDDTPIVYQFNENEAHALNEGGLKSLASVPTQAIGTHRLRAEFHARADTGKPHARLITARIDQPFDTAATPAVLALTVRAVNVLSSASLDLQTFGADPLPHEADLLLAGDRPFAAAVLFEVSNLGDPARVQAARSRLGLPADAGTTPPLLSRYNAAIADRNAGQDAALQQLGEASVQDTQGLAARDLGNVTLGYRALQEGRVDLAADSFRRVRSPGPYSNAAMLGLGWSCLLPSGEHAAAMPVSLRPASADAIAVTRRQTPFRYLQAVVDGKRADDLRRALVPWSELIGRDPLDPAVQEGMLVIPYALDHLGAHAQAQDYYQRAVDRLQAARQTLSAAQHEVSDGSVLAELDARDADTRSGWPRLLVERQGDRAVPLRTLIEDPQVASSLHDYRQLQEMDRALADDRARLADQDPALAAQIDALRTRIAGARETVAVTARQALVASLQARDRQTSVYLAEAEFALARIDDRLPHGASAP